MKSAPQMEIERATKVNRQALQEFINELYGIDAGKMAMQVTKSDCPCNPVRGYECGTVMCIGGLYRAFYTNWDESRGLADMARSMALEFGLNRNDVEHMLIMNDPPGPHAVNYDFYEFDARIEPEKRKECMIRVLEIAMETGRPSWTQALVDVLGPEVALQLHDRCQYVKVLPVYEEAST